MKEIDLISEIEAEMLSFSQKGGIIVQGDYHARTGDIQEVVMNDDNTFLPVPEDNETDSQFAGFQHSKRQGQKLIRNMYRIKFANFQREDCW